MQGNAKKGEGRPKVRGYPGFDLQDLQDHLQDLQGHLQDLL